MATNNPSVSVIVPTLNRAHLLERAVLSVLTSSYPLIELLVVDQNSQDHTHDLLQHLGVSWIQDDGHGAGRGRKKGLAHSKGDFVLFLDSDDWLTASAVSQLVKQAMTSQSALTYGYSLRTDINGADVAPHARESAQLAPLTSATLARRTVFEEVGIFDDDNFSWPRWMIRARIQGVEESTVEDIVVFRGIHSHNVSKEAGATSELFSLIRSHRDGLAQR